VNCCSACPSGNEAILTELFELGAVSSLSCPPPASSIAFAEGGDATTPGNHTAQTFGKGSIAAALGDNKHAINGINNG
jgi:hypothetical protein